MDMEKLLLKCRLANQPVDMIYLDQKGRISHRTIFVKRVKDGYLLAFCTMKGQQRTFCLNQILAVEKNQDKEHVHVVSPYQTVFGNPI
jgi:predicted DNA-binding transcriptional regulator YafY